MYTACSLDCILVHVLFLLIGERLKSSDERDSMIVDCLISLGRLDEAAKKLTEMILAKPDQWSYIKTYVKCQVQRCQNFRERVRQQVERDRKSREEGEGGITAENSRLGGGDDVGVRSEASEAGEAVEGEVAADAASDKGSGEKTASSECNGGSGGGSEESRGESPAAGTNEVTVR